MKRFLSVLLVLVMACSVIACGGKAKEEEIVSKQEEKRTVHQRTKKDIFY